VRCYIAALPTGLLAVTVRRWDSPAALVIQIALGAALLIAGFRVMKIVGEKEKELILKLPIPFKERIVALF
jgi:hypothetical protein